MAPPARAVVGSVSIAAAPVLKVTDYNVKAARETTSVGPWIGEDTITDIPGGIKTTIDFTVDVPEGGNAGQTAVFTAISAGTHPALIFIADDGLTFTIASPTYTGYDAKGEAKGGQQIKFSATGDCVVSVTA